MNDQIFPLRDTDAEQIISMMAAFAHAGADMLMLLPRKWGRPAVTKQEIEVYYEVMVTFSIAAVRSSFPSFRGVEKISHGLRGTFANTFTSADVIYTRNLPSVLTSLIMSSKPVVYETYRPWPDQQRILRPIIRWITRHPAFLGAVFHSKLAEDSFVKNGLPNNKSLVAYNGYNPKRMLPVLTKDAARRMLNLPIGSHIVTYTGSMRLDKGLDIILNMAGILPDIYFVLVGSCGYHEVEDRAQAIANVQIVPWQQFSETTPYLYASDVLIIPPTAQPLEKVGTTVLPLKTFLYMATLRPIFGPATPDLLEILKNDDNAVLVDPTDTVTSICMTLDQFLKDPGKQAQLAAKAASDVAALTWENRGRQVLSFIKKRLTAYKCNTNNQRKI